MSDWSSVALSIGSAGIGALAPHAGTGMQLRSARRARERSDQAARRARAAAIVGPILGVLADMEPRAIAQAGGRSPQTIENIGRRWWRSRDDLLVFGVASPSPKVADAAQVLADGIARVWASTNALNRTPADEQLLETARQDHEQAVALARAFESATRQA